MQRSMRYISSLMLLILIFVVGARSVYAFTECQCQTQQIEQHHSCRSCVEHVDDCVKHDHKIEHKCNRAIYFSDDAVIKTQETKSSNRVHYSFKLILLESNSHKAIISTKLSLSPYLNREESLPKDQYLPLWRSLRAPPQRV